MEQVTLEKEIFVETSNKPGVASELTTLLSKKGHLNLKTLWNQTQGNKGHFAFIPEDLSKAREILTASPFSNFREEDVVVAYIKDQAGSASEITSKLAAANININWLYLTSYDGKPALVLSCDDNSLAAKTIKR